MYFDGQTVWITGASAGIGEALAHEFARRGARIILSARRESELERVRKDLPNPANHRVVVLDLEDGASINGATQQVLADGPVDVLVNNGGLSQRANALDTDLSVDRRLMEVNYFGTIALTKLVVPKMVTRGSGHVLVISSVAGKLGAPQRSAYAASKHALHGFFDVLRAEVYDNGVFVTIACPGYIRTDISRNALTADGHRYEQMDDNQRNGMDPDACAREIVDAVRKRKAEIYVGGRETLGVYLKRFTPNLLNRILRKAANA